jgi:hypothetical protein
MHAFYAGSTNGQFWGAATRIKKTIGKVK